MKKLVENLKDFAIINYKDFRFAIGMLYGVTWFMAGLVRLLYGANDTTTGSFGPWWFELNIEHKFISVCCFVCFAYAMNGLNKWIK